MGSDEVGLRVEGGMDKELDLPGLWDQGEVLVILNLGVDIWWLFLIARLFG